MQHLIIIIFNIFISVSSQPTKLTKYRLCCLMNTVSNL
uniref:Uncharacterized protein n=1 Tax=Arundo donax TaxID=35708 RepID=A0A0A8YZH1_ARUDO